MLGTNDAKDPGDGGPNNWLHNCGGADGTTLKGCSFADDYASMIEEVQPLIKYLRPYKYLINRK